MMSRFFVIFFTNSVKFFTKSIEIYYMKRNSQIITDLANNSGFIANIDISQ